VTRLNTASRACRPRGAVHKFGHKPKLTPHQQHEAIQRRDKGEYIGEIARSYKVNPSRISRLTA
jgi:helix-turn-helix resolvase-like protein